MRQCETQMITRRFFIAGAVSFGAFHGLRAFAAPSDFGLRRRGNLRFGVISDIHVALSLKDGVTPNGMPRIVEDAFRYFRDQGVDAVVIPGNLASFGTVAELWLVADAWNRTFPDGKLPDGRRVERIFVMQSDSFPAYERESGIVVNRVRDLKIAAELGKPIVALCDANAGQYDIDEREYMRPLVEDLIWRGIPTDRTVMSPKRVPGFIDRKRLEARKPQMAELNRLAAEHRDVLSAPSYRPVRILYPADALMFSKAAHGGVTATEEILLRNHGRTATSSRAAPRRRRCRPIARRWSSPARSGCRTRRSRRSRRLRRRADMSS